MGVNGLIQSCQWQEIVQNKDNMVHDIFSPIHTKDVVLASCFEYDFIYNCVMFFKSSSSFFGNLNPEQTLPNSNMIN